MDNISDMINEQFYTVATGHVYDTIICYIEKMVIIKALEQSDGNQVAAAKILGLHRNTLRSKIMKFNIEVWSFKK
jgi:DNA-binding protein Fis